MIWTPASKRWRSSGINLDAGVQTIFTDAIFPFKEAHFMKYETCFLLYKKEWKKKVRKFYLITYIK